VAKKNAAAVAEVEKTEKRDWGTERNGDGMTGRWRDWETGEIRV
jgi:hypothetical protein